MSTPQPNPPTTTTTTTTPLPHLLLRTLQFLTAAALAALTIPLTTRVNSIYPLLPSDTAPTSVVLLHALLAIALLTALYTPLPLLAFPRLAKSRSLATAITTTNDILLALALFVLATYTDGTLTPSLLSLQPSPHTLYIRADGWEPLPAGGDLRPPPGGGGGATEVAMGVAETEVAFLLRMARAAVALAAGLGAVLVVAAVWGVVAWWREKKMRREVEEEEARRVEEKRAVVEEVEEV